MNTSTTHENLTIGCYNTRGLVSALPFIRLHLAEVDILAIAEHWLYEDALTALDHALDTHRGWGRADRRLKDKENRAWRRGQWGVALVWKTSIDYAVHKLEDGNDRLMGIRIRLRNGQKSFVFAVYLPHANSPMEEYRDQLDVMVEVYGKYENEGSVLFVGDFNAELGQEGGQRGRGQTSRFGSELLSTMEELGLISLNLNIICEGPIGTCLTYSSKQYCETTIDDILMAPSLLPEIKSCKVIDEQSANISDHNPIVVSLLIKPVVWEEGEIHLRPDWKRMSDQETQKTYQMRLKERHEQSSR
ncbi:uncharacterized protein [Branchiostoma lanceolatum]|uniref:uncharacterized protein n=1 Tax=Branchiostoma lanceolatum TaxID=7740 RepID=UPI0034515CEB